MRVTPSCMVLLGVLGIPGVPTAEEEVILNLCSCLLPLLLVETEEAFDGIATSAESM